MDWNECSSLLPRPDFLVLTWSPQLQPAFRERWLYHDGCVWRSPAGHMCVQSPTKWREKAIEKSSGLRKLDHAIR